MRERCQIRSRPSFKYNIETNLTEMSYGAEEWIGLLDERLWGREVFLIIRAKIRFSRNAILHGVNVMLVRGCIQTFPD
jgi:hypothetical protein